MIDLLRKPLSEIRMEEERKKVQEDQTQMELINMMMAMQMANDQALMEIMMMMGGMSNV